MLREFIYFKIFDKNWGELGLTDDDLRELESELLKNPNAGTIIPGTGGLRKMRFALPNRGKSGSLRVLYVDFISYKKTVFMNVYAKSQQANITEEQKRNLKKIIDSMIKELAK